MMNLPQFTYHLPNYPRFLYFLPLLRHQDHILLVGGADVRSDVN